MKNLGKILCLVISLSLLSSCSIFLEDRYSAVSPHLITEISEGSVISVDNYYELVNALVYYVTEHSEVGQIRFVNYEKDLARSHLTEAVIEVLMETVLGSYGVENITWELNMIVANLEAVINIEYKKTQEDYEAILLLNGATAMTRSLIQNLSDMGTGLVIQNSYASSNRNQISQIIHLAFSGAASSLVEIPQVHTTFYPKEGPWRMVEISFQYSLGETVRSSRQKTLEQAIETATSQMWSGSDRDRYQTLMWNLWESAQLEGVGNTPYDVLVNGSGTNRGFALSVAALCQELSLECLVVEGEYLGEVHYWNQIILENGVVYHVDITQGVTEEDIFPYWSDDELEDLGYDWDKAHVLVSEVSMDTEEET